MDPVWVIIVIAAAALFLFSGRLRRSGPQKIKQFAKSRGWQYEGHNSDVLARYPQRFPLHGSVGVGGLITSALGVKLPSSGPTRSASDVVHVRLGEYEGHSFTCEYETPTRGDDVTYDSHYWYVVGMQLPVPFPSITVSRRRRLPGLNPSGGGGEVVELPMAEFAQSYEVRSEHPPAATEIITPDTATWLLGQDLPIEIVLEDDAIFTYRKGRSKEENIEPMLGLLTGFLQRIDPIAWRKAQGEYPRPRRGGLGGMGLGDVGLGQIQDVIDRFRPEED